MTLELHRLTLRVFILVVVVALISCTATTGFAGLILQLYAEGGVYDTESESWVVSVADGSPIRIWAIGNVSGPGGAGPISEVRLAVSYDASAEDGGPLSVFLAPSTTMGFNGITDPSTPSVPGFIQKVTDGSTPILGDGDPLPPHGVYGPGTYWQEFALGDFVSTDSPIGDFIFSFPTTLTPSSGQINVYEVTVDSPAAAPVDLHFDLYNHVSGRNGIWAKFAPFSHDADGAVAIIPEASSLIAWALGAVAFCAACVFRRRTQSVAR